MLPKKRRQGRGLERKKVESGEKRKGKCVYMYGSKRVARDASDMPPKT